MEKLQEHVTKHKHIDKKHNLGLGSEQRARAPVVRRGSSGKLDALDALAYLDQNGDVSRVQEVAAKRA